MESIVCARNREQLLFLGLRDKVGENKNAVQIKNPKPEVKKILEIANFDKLFTVE